METMAEAATIPAWRMTCASSNSRLVFVKLLGVH